MKLDFPDKVVLHISGTASVDEKGDTVHLDDPYKQIQRMLLNVKELLAAQGATFEDITQIATFLKRAATTTTASTSLVRTSSVTTSSLTSARDAARR